MLNGMLEKSKEDKHAEMVEWSAFKTWCSNTELQKQTAIQDADVQKDTLKADMEQHDSEVKRLGEEIKAHEADITKYKEDQKKASDDRKAERDAYQKTLTDYSESITAITNAIGVLKKQAADIPQAASMLQAVKHLPNLPISSKRAIDNFLSMGLDTEAVESLSAPGDAKAYEFQSGTIITLLEELKDKFIDERTSLEKKEMTAQQAFEMVMLDLRNAIEVSSNEISKKGQAKADNVAGSTESSSLFDEVKASRDDDQEYLTGLTSTCQQKSADFKSRQQLREEEQEALSKAIEIISGEAVSGAADKHLPSALQLRRSTSLIQFLSAAQKPNQEKAIMFLNEESQRLRSHVLSAIAMQMTADPFEKVKKLISDLIEKLKKQEEEEADHKKWCDEELKTNGQTRKEKTAKVDELTSTIDQLESRLAVLKKDLGDLASGIADINTAVSKAMEMRAKEKDTNEATIAEAVEGQTAIAKAKQILSNFYKKAGEATAFTQQEPPIFDEAFKGQQQQSSNVLSFLEVISSDFARLETDTKKAEEAAQSEHDDFMAESKKSKEAKEEEVKTKEKEQLDKTNELSLAEDNLESSQKQLNAAMDYFDKLKPSCVNVAQPYQERVQRREDEIQALKEALEILNGETLSSGPDALYSSTQGGNLKVL